MNVQLLLEQHRLIDSTLINPFLATIDTNIMTTSRRSIGLLVSATPDRHKPDSTQELRHILFHFFWFLLSYTAFFSHTATSDAHHLREPAVHTVNKRDSDRPLRIINNCPEIIYPAILTVSGVGPVSSGFRLEPGWNRAQTVSADWRGRVWGRTNCSFNADGSLPMSGQGGRACGSGDCGQFVECLGAVS